MGPLVHVLSAPRLEGVDTIFRDAATAWCVVDLGLAVQGCQAIQMAGGGATKAIFIEGNIGRSNPVYRSVISTLFPAAAVWYGTLGGAPYGAAILGAAAVKGVRPEALADRCRMNLKDVPKLDAEADALRTYVAAFLGKIGTGTCFGQGAKTGACPYSPVSAIRSRRGHCGT